MIVFLKSRVLSQGVFLLGFTFIALATTVAVRLLPHIPNFTPLGAFALFVGVFVARKHWWGLLLPLLAMFLSDLFIGFYDLKLMAVVYGSFLAYTAMGMLVAKRRSIATVFLGSIGGAILFYLTTNFAVWAFSSWYPHTIQGLMLSYTFALPFFKYTILGDLFFTSILFGVYEFATSFLYQRQVKLSLTKVGIT
ncbi:MAG: hypothetical protein A3C82_01080 [Candidatus Wildermuthbacteria bacterium RIFCSPHIGHO2_02_FULL_47_12]|uniref:Rod shape-determining protein MreD n=1 Tax=Candidatus Wildermuthbacteria bacterium RIFCSPHIGHO2_02_FULL_47_12 TaxID=1802451 RepID=A0A1G2R468_9BACT|nr:MAG: hypothetical protein A3C82_01080 [Candidatus Wildermuthbacteria bacterium RIFCSPHIGHO2_02_FULL_47_12]